MGLGHHTQVVGESESSKVHARGRRASQSGCQIGHVCHRSSVRDIARNRKELVECRWSHYRLRVVIRDQYKISTSVRLIYWHHNCGRLGVLLDVVREVDQRLEVILDRGLWIDDKATPHAIIFESPEMDLGHNSEIVVSALQNREEIRVINRTCCDNAPVGENNLELQDVIANHALLRTEIGNTAAECQAADANGRGPASSRDNAVGLQSQKYVVPNGTWTDFHKAIFGIILYRADVLQIDGDPIVDIGRTSVRSVTTATDREFAGSLRGDKCLDRKRDVLSCLWLNDAIWCYGLLLDIEV